MDRLIQKVTKFVDSLTSKGKLIFVLSIFLFLVLFYSIFIANNDRSSNINYKNLNVEKLISNSTLVYDREKLYSLQEITNKILKISDESWILDEKPVTIKKLYSVAVMPGYKKKISFRSFKNKLDNIFEETLGKEKKFDAENNYIDTVYYNAEYNMYVVKFSTQNQEDNAYLGIIMDDGKYLITYVE